MPPPPLKARAERKQRERESMNQSKRGYEEASKIQRNMKRNINITLSSWYCTGLRLYQLKNKNVKKKR
jgi:hypothetical protein